MLHDKEMYNLDKETYELLEQLRDRFEEDKDTGLQAFAQCMVRQCACSNDPVDLLTWVAALAPIISILEDIEDEDWREIAEDLSGVIQYMLVEIFAHGRRV